MKHKNSQQSLLIVDDKQDMLKLLKQVIGSKLDCQVDVAESGYEAVDRVKKKGHDVVLTDIKMPDLDGLSLMKEILAFDPTISVIIMTGYATVEGAVEALKEGALDFFQKPFDNDMVIHAVKKGFERTNLLRENRRLQEQLHSVKEQYGFVGESTKLKKVLELMSRVADTDVTVLIRGESGTGKEVAARALHQMSRRRNKKMITVNCPALPEHILESELFGYVKGAFTGADTDKEGLFLAANGSTILLDEIADIPLSIQTKLLRVLQEKEIRPLGTTKSIKVDVRVIASTNQDLEKKIEEGTFREDLFYRLNVVTVTMPSLKEIAEDIPLLAQSFLEKYSKEYGKEGLEFAPESIRCLMQREWKGNVRQLQNAVKRAVLLASSNVIWPSDIPTDNGKDSGMQMLTMPCVSHLPYKQAKEEVMSRFSVAYLTKVLQESKGNVTLAAKKCGLERQSLQRLLRRYKVDPAGFRVKTDGQKA